MHRFRDMPINRKLTVVILLTCSAVLLLAGAAMVATELVTSRRAMTEEMTVLADLLASNSAAPLAFHREEDADELDRLLSALRADPPIMLAGVYDREGLLFSAYSRGGESRPPARPPPMGTRFTDGALDVSRPILLDQKPIGVLFLRSDMSRVYERLWLHAGIVGSILLGLFIVTTALSPRLRRPIAEPILALADVARRVAQNRDYSTRATRYSQDEVGLLTDAFNQMLSEIEAGQSSLQKANASMQAEIIERRAVEERLRRAHDELADAKDAAESASRAKDQFLAVLSHELRTPLTPVLLIVSLLEARDDLPQDVDEDVQTIRRHVELEARLIDDLLDLTRITRGKLKLDLETIDAHVLIRDAVQICCADRSSDVTIALAATRHHVNADRARLLQIFWNLLNNARKFTPAGRSITVRTCDAPDGQIRIAVTDSGIGIEPDALPKIFNAFEQGNAQMTRTFGGLGLGLAIAKALVDAHGGSIRADSAGAGTGATFTVELPTVPSPSGVESAAPSDADVPAGPGGLRVLLVEDHPGTLELMVKLLERLGHAVSPAGNVHDALELAGGAPFDLVVSDLGLPDGSGLDLMRQLRATYGLKGICLSGYGMDEDLARSAEAGFQKHLIKPVDLEMLDRAIAAVTVAPPAVTGSAHSGRLS